MPSEADISAMVIRLLYPSSIYFIIYFILSSDCVFPDGFDEMEWRENSR